ncbi:response regulator [Acidovorax sp. ACV02]|uniref:response regulator n=1 Tax=Acidovorax sp. ACV02 TaxID=2769310 RepID=UPI001783ECA8|nr:response regulator [Acidovorax sp. ACV02]MBD9407355.1 response regulator [Acidovorax sp. ACV02]
MLLLLKRQRFFLRFFLPVVLAVLVGMGFDYAVQQHTQTVQRKALQSQEEDIQVAAKAEAISRKLLEIKLRLTQTLTVSKYREVDEAKAYQLHGLIVDEMAALEKDLTALTTAHDFSHVSTHYPAALRAFQEFRQFALMSSDQMAIDQSAAGEHLISATAYYGVFALRMGDIAKTFMDHAIENAATTRNQLQDFDRRMRLYSTLAALVFLALWFVLSRSTSRQLDQLNTILQKLSRGESGLSDYKTFSRIKAMAAREGTHIGDMANAVLAFQKTQDERRLALAELHDREELHANIISQAPIGIVVLDLQTLQFVSFNDATYESLGYTREEFSQMNLYDLQLNSDRSKVDAKLRRIQALGGQDFETQRRDKAGNVRDFWVSMRPLHLHDRDCMTGIWVDITSRKQSERELARYRDELEQLVAERTLDLEKTSQALAQQTLELQHTNAQLRSAKAMADEANQAKSAFLANMSHEIRTPMNAIIGLTHLIRRDTTNPHQRQQLDKVSGAAMHLLAVINDILDFSKIEAGKMALDPTDFELEKVVSNVFTITGDKAEAKGLEVMAELAGVPPILHGDGMRLGQILTNFMGNAVKFTERGSVSLHAFVTHREANQVRLRFEVRDTGIGLSPEQQGKLFLAFQQADVSTTRTHGGTGLGLAISRRLADLMDGQVGVRSEPGRGSTFWFEAPFGISSQAAAPQHVQALPPSTRVLVVDDMEEARELLADMLTHLGARADAVSSGALAVQAVAQADELGDPYELVLTDWLMPGLNGTQTWQQICALPLQHRPACILVSGSLSCPADEVDAGPFAAFLPKPVLPTALEDVLVRVWNHAQLPEAAAPALAADAPVRFTPGLQLLLAEDNALNQEVAGELLRQLGFAVDVAGDGTIAVERARERHYDLILMDIQMPHLDGLQATRQIRALPGHAQTPIVAMTANAFAEDRAAALAAGMNDHLPKPVDPAQLARVLARLLPHSVDATGAAPTPSVATSTPTLAHETQMRAQLQSVVGFQLEQGLRSLGNNFAALVRLLQRMVMEHPQDAQKALQAWQGGDLAETQRILHTLKGLAGTAGLTGLQVAAQQAEARVQAAPPGGLDADAQHALQDLDARLHQLVQSLHFVVDASAQTTSTAPAASADHLRQGLRTLRPLLASDDLDASAAYAELHPAMLQHYPDRAQALAQAIDGFDFLQALALLDAILASADGGSSSDTPPASTQMPAAPAG